MAHHVSITLLKYRGKQAMFTVGSLLHLRSYKCFHKLTHLTQQNIQENYHQTMTQMTTWAQKG